MLALQLTAFAALATYQLLTMPVLQNREVEPIIVEAHDKKPALIISISKNGTTSHSNKIVTNEQLAKLCKQHTSKHPDGVLHLKSHKETTLEDFHAVIRTASKAGLDRVIFSAHGQPKDHAKAAIPKAHRAIIEYAVKKSIKAREQDLKMALPAANPNDPEKIPALAPLFIAISKESIISVNRGAGKEQLDLNPQKRDLPLLKERLEAFVAVAKTTGQEPIVQIWADGQANQQRIVDVLNALAASKISKVTFVDVINE